MVNQTFVLRINPPWRMVKIATFAKPQTVTSKCRATVQPSTFVLTLDDKMPTLRKIKRVAMPTHEPTQIAAHLI